MAELRFPVLPRPVRQLLRPLVLPAAGMRTQQRFMDVIAANIANASTTRTPEGGPYRRQVAVAQGTGPGGATVSVVQDGQPGRLVYDPGHPDATADGFVAMPNVDVTLETVDLMIVRRMHDANATVFQAAKAMLRRALEI